MSRALNALGRSKPGRTFAQSLAALLGANGIGLADVDWAAALSVSGMAGLLSALFIWAQGQAWLAEPRTPGAHEA